MAILSAEDKSIPGIMFDGSNQYYSRLSDFSGNADGPSGIFHCYLKATAALTENKAILISAAGKYQIVTDNSNSDKLYIQCANAASEVILNLDGNIVISPNVEYSVLISWTIGGATHFYVNDQDVKVENTNTTGDIDYTVSTHELGGFGGNNLWPGVISRVYFNVATSMDFSVTANRRKFISENNSPVFLGADGSTPTGSQPLVYVDGTTTDGTNLGSGGNYVSNNNPTAGFIKTRTLSHSIPPGMNYGRNF